MTGGRERKRKRPEFSFAARKTGGRAAPRRSLVTIGKALWQDGRRPARPAMIHFN
jgi:hypothetical protein